MFPCIFDRWYSHILTVFLREAYWKCTRCVFIISYPCEILWSVRNSLHFDWCKYIYSPWTFTNSYHDFICLHQVGEEIFKKKTLLIFGVLKWKYIPSVLEGCVFGLFYRMHFTTEIQITHCQKSKNCLEYWQSFAIYTMCFYVFTR